jgi:hypothetical protein
MQNNVRAPSRLAVPSARGLGTLSQFERAYDGNCLLNGEVNGRYIRMMTYIHVLSVIQHSSCFNIFVMAYYLTLE